MNFTMKYTTLQQQKNRQVYWETPWPTLKMDVLNSNNSAAWSQLDLKLTQAPHQKVVLTKVFQGWLLPITLML
jgi:hypothetical protein